MEVKRVKVGKFILGKGEPVRVQSMTNTKTENIESTSEQILHLSNAGAEIIRIAVPTKAAASAVKEYKASFPEIPLVADIHFDHRLAIASIENGIDKVRINPGNIGSQGKVGEVCRAASERDIPIRVGVNGGSLPKDIEEKYGGATAEALVAAAERELLVLEKNAFYNIVFSLKSSGVPVTVEANRLFRKKHPYPLHIGITEAGLPGAGTVLSSVGMGILLYEGIGETIRVSLTGDPLREVKVARQILSALEIRKQGITLISCPTCGRTEIPVESLAREVEKAFADFPGNISVAVMGCVVNGPGEARHADIGITGSSTEYVIFMKDQVVARFSSEKTLPELAVELKRLSGTL